MLSAVIGFIGVVFGVAGTAFVAVDRCACANRIWLTGDLFLTVDAISFGNYFIKKMEG